MLAVWNAFLAFEIALDYMNFFYIITITGYQLQTITKAVVDWS